MAITNQERVGKAMELVRQGLAPFAEREFKNLHTAQAVNAHGGFGRWRWAMARQPGRFEIF
ncbi:MAG: hypothetical protein M5R38_09645 [Candidatus Methylomirabilis sp.]|nr:hypothetical protein [Candidatus Methylomirabilis sp.]